MTRLRSLLIVFALATSWVSGTRAAESASSPSALQFLRWLATDSFGQAEKSSAELRAVPYTINGDYPPAEILGEDVEPYLARLSDSQRERRLAQADAWQRQFPKSPAPLIFRARVYLALANSLRQDQTLPHLQPEIAARCQAALQAAEDALNAAEALPTSDPSIVPIILRVAGAYGNDNPTYWIRYEKARKATPAYRPLYLWAAAYSRDAMAGPGLWASFIGRAADNWPGEQGDVLYAGMARMLGTNKIHGLLETDTFSYLRLKRGLEALLRAHPDSQYELNALCFYAWCAGDYLTVRAFLPRIGDTWRPDVWGAETWFRECQKNTSYPWVPSKRFADELIDAEDFATLEQIGSDLRALPLPFYQGYSSMGLFYGEIGNITSWTNDDTWTKRLAHFDHWASAYPKSPTPLIAAGLLYTNFGWMARGTDWADTVSDEAWKKFDTRLKLAREKLMAATALDTPDPEAYRSLIVIAMAFGEPRKRVIALLRRGLEISPNYLGLYDAVLTDLLPRWNGEEGEMERFLAEEADKRGGDEGDILYMVTARNKMGRFGWFQFFDETHFNYARMKRGFEASLKHYPDYAWDLNSYCLYACLADDRDTAALLFKRIGDTPLSDIWNHEAYAIWRGWALDGKERPTAKDFDSSGSD